MGNGKWEIGNMKGMQGGKSNEKKKKIELVFLLEVGSGKGKVGNGKFEVGSGKGEVGNGKFVGFDGPV